MKTKLFTLLLAVAASVGTMFASNTEVNGIWYDFNSSNRTATVTYRGAAILAYYNEYIGSVVIPASVSYGGRTYSVTSIGEGAFWGCDGLTSVTIPNSVTSIGDDAFKRCTGLASIEIPNSVTSIGSGAFLDCSGLTSVTIPNSVTSIGALAFSGCAGLTSPVYNAHVFAYLPTSYSGAYTIPDGIESIAGGAFSAAAAGLTSVTIGNSVTSIGSQAFSGCSGLTSVTIPNSVTSIGGWAFNKCTGLTSVAIGNSVTSIGDYAFHGCSVNTINFTGTLEDLLNKVWSPVYISNNYKLKINGVLQENIIIPNSVINIGDNAFNGCNSLASIEIPNSVTSIGDGAFGSCSGLFSVTINSDSIVSKSNLRGIFGSQVKEYIIGDGVTSIGKDAFSGCSGLTSVTIGNSVDSIGYEAFYECSGLTSVTIPNSVTIIGNRAFIGCRGLTSVTIGNSVTSIGNNAFWGCSSLTSIIWNAKNGPSYNFGNQVTSFTFGNDVEVIPASICSGMTNLTSITIGNSVDSIGENAFRGCTSLASVMWNAKACKNFTYNNTPFYNGGSYDSRFDIRSQITSFTFGDTVEKIPSCLCSRMTNLTSVKIGNSVDSIGEWAFLGCSGLTSVTISNSVTSIGDYAFSGCSGLTSVTIPNSVTSIGDYAFSGCTGLTSVTIPNSVTSIGDFAFYGCTGLTSVTIPNSVTSIGDYAFSGCTGLTSVTIPNSVTSIGESAFYDCTGLTSVIWNVKNGPTCYFGDQVTSFTFGDDVEVIPASICYGMTNLTSVTIPNSVTSIGESAFRSCTALTSVTIPNSVTSIGDKAFYSCTGLTSVTIPNSVTSIGNYAFSNCSGLTSVTIGNSVTSIGNYAFNKCTGLTSVTCLAPTPPTCWSRKCFSEVNCSNIPLYVPMENVSLYQAANIWKEFNVIGVMFADEVETAVFSATPTDDYGVILEWQALENAVLYNIDIIQGNDTIRELQFDSNGKLLNSPSNAPSRYPNIHHASTAILSGNGWRYEVNDLDPGTNYTYSITVKAENGSVLYTQSIGFTTKEETFIIKFVNWNGEELLVLPEVVKGTTPSYTGETPVRPNTAEYTYTFAGWTPTVVAVTGDATYTATYTATKNSYTITWQNEDGSLIDQTTVEYGVVPTHAEPTKQATAEYTYTFAGWTPAVVAVTGDATYKATFSSVVNVYTISVSAVNGQVIGGGEYQYGTTTDLTAIPDEGYVFDQWADGVTDNPRTITVTGNVEYTALFKSAEGLENIYTSEPVQKVIIDQKVYILRGEKVYTVTGQEVR